MGNLPETKSYTFLATGYKYPETEQGLQAFLYQNDIELSKKKLCECHKKSLSCNTKHCVNFSSQTVCPSDCQSGDKCRNQILRNLSYKRDEFEVCRDSCCTAMGTGLITKQFIKKNSPVMEYTGKLVSFKSYQNKSTSLQVKARRAQMKQSSFTLHLYGLDMGEKYTVDAECFGNHSRFANSSCDPSCHMEFWTIDGLKRAFLFANRRHKPGDHVTWGYNFKDALIDMKCLCKPGCEAYIFKKGSKFPAVTKTEEPIRPPNLHPDLMIKPCAANQNRKFLCNKCERTFTNRRNMVRHRKSMHGDRKLICNYCTKAFGRTDNLQEHIKLKHTAGG